MRRKKKKWSNYSAEYKTDELRLKLNRGIKIKVNLKDNLEVGVLLAKLKEAGLASSRDLGKVFRRSPATVINKVRESRMGSERLIDSRGQKKHYKIEEIRSEILYIWAKGPSVSDKEILNQLQGRLRSLGMRLDIKTLARFIKEIGIDEARSRFRRNPRINFQLPETAQFSTAADKEAIEDSKEEEIIQTYSRYGGQMLHIPQLYKMNFAEMTEVLTEPKRRIYSKERVGLLLYLLYSIGGKRLNELDYVDHSGFGVLVGMKDNIRCSGMNKRVEKLAEPKTIEVFQEKALSGRKIFINRKDFLSAARQESWHTQIPT